jgi:hypothetical protein
MVMKQVRPLHPRMIAHVGSHVNPTFWFAGSASWDLVDFHGSAAIARSSGTVPDCGPRVVLEEWHEACSVKNAPVPPKRRWNDL